MPQLSAAQAERERHRQRAESASQPSQPSQPSQAQANTQQPAESSLPPSQETDVTGNSSDGSKAEIYILDGPGREDSSDGVHDLGAHIQATAASAQGEDTENGEGGLKASQTARSTNNREKPPLLSGRRDANGKGKDKSHSNPPSSSSSKSNSASTSSSSSNGKKETPSTRKSERRLFVFHGLRPELLSQLPSMGVDPDFITAHLLRRPYRPRLVQLKGQQRHGPGGEKVVKWSFAHFQYPELVCRMGEDSSSGGEEGYLGAGSGKRDHSSGEGKGGGGREGASPHTDNNGGGRGPHTTHGAHGAHGGVDEHVVPAAGRIAGDPPVLSMPGREDAVVMCRASLWMSEKGDAVLLLDRPIWRDPQVRLRKTYWHDSLSNSLRPSQGDDTSSLRSYMTADATPATVIEHGAPSLHDALQEWLNNYPSDFDYRAVLSSVVELAYDRWLELFDALDLRPMPSSQDRGATRGPQGQDGVNDLLSLYWRSQMALETNLDGFAYMTARGMVMPKGRADWGVLLTKIKRRVQLLNLAATISRPAATTPAGTGTNTVAFKTTDAITMGGDAEVGASSGGKINRHRHHHHRRMSAPLAALTTQPAAPIMEEPVIAYSPQEKERARGLERVAYMGGIFLPFTIVSSVLSMSEPFSPGQNMHWIFWALAVPLAIGAVLFIYADNIRQAEVWIEVSDWHDDHEKAKEFERQEQEKYKYSGQEEGLPAPVPGPPAKFKTRRSWRRRNRAEEQQKPASIMSGSESILEADTKTEAVGLYGIQNSQYHHGRHGDSATPPSRPQLRRETGQASFNVMPPSGEIDLPVHIPPSTSTSSSASSLSDGQSIRNYRQEHEGGVGNSTTHLRPDSHMGNHNDHNNYEDDEERLVAEQTPSDLSPPQSQPQPQFSSQQQQQQQQHHHGGNNNNHNEEMASRAETGTIRTVTRRPTMIFQAGAHNGDNPRAWKKQRLGWGGAWKTMVGYYVPRKGEDVPLGVKAYEVRGGKAGTTGATTGMGVGMGMGMGTGSLRR